MSNVNMLLVFTFGVSLKRWKDIGSLDREIRPYIWLSQNGYNITLLTYGGIEDKEYLPKNSGITVISVFTFYKKSKFSFINLIKSLAIPFYMKAYDVSYDLIKTNQVWGGWVAVLLKYKYAALLIVRLGYEPYMNSLSNPGILKRLIFKYTSLFSYRVSDCILVSTKSIKNFISNTYKINKYKIKVFPNYIDTSYFSPTDSVKKFNDRVLYVGRLAHEKNIIPMAKLFIGSEVQLDIVGSGECLPELIKLKENYGANITIIGPVENSSLVDYYRKYKVILLLSKYEGHPKTLLEAMSTGLIPIGLNVQGINTVINHNQSGFIVDTISTDILLIVKDILSNDYDEKSAEARNDILKCCEMNDLFERKSVLYKKLLEHSVTK